MAYTDKLIDEFNKEEDTVVETTTSTEDTPSTVKEPETVEDLDKPADKKEPPKETTVEETPADDKPADKPDLTQVSKEAKAEHAFKRQLSKQKEKHEAELKELKETWQKQFDELKSTLTPKEPIKTRADFKDDDTYIKYLASLQVNDIMAERDKKAAEESAKAEEERKAQQARQEENDALSRTFGENSRRAFTGDAFTEYSAKVNKAIDNGLGELLDSVPAIRDYIFKNPEGPVVLNKMLSDRDSFVRVMCQTDPTMMIIAAHELARESVAPVQPVVEETHTVPHLGKPGARNASSDAGSMFGSDKSLMAYVRSVNSRRR